MSEQLYQPRKNAVIIFDFTNKLINSKVSREEVVKVQAKLHDSTPKDFIAAVDLLVQNNPVSNKMKSGINKMLNVFYTYLSTIDQPALKEGSFLDQLVKDNIEVVKLIDTLKPTIKEVQKLTHPSEQLFKNLNTTLNELSKVDIHFHVMENVLFSFLEKQWPDHRCFQVLWSVHDDARNEINELKQMINPESWDLKLFNRLTGDLFFNFKTIIFREEKILLPAIIEAGFSDDLDKMMPEVAEIGWSFIDLIIDSESAIYTQQNSSLNGHFVDFTTGQLSFEQIDLIFNHLPIDITFVDEEDTVRYFSTPKKRTFPRTPSVIGRKVQNCHPPESVYMVEEILDTFKKGEQDEASFWIPFGEQFVHIQYFAVRDNANNYRGTIEVTQDISGIKKLEGERRLLNWKKD